MNPYVTWEGLTWLILLGGLLKMSSKLVQNLGSLPKRDVLLYLVAGFFFGGALTTAYYIGTQSSEPRMGTTEVYRPVQKIPEVRIAIPHP